jgi:hypothetical protein
MLTITDMWNQIRAKYQMLRRGINARGIKPRDKTQE